MSLRGGRWRIAITPSERTAVRRLLRAWTDRLLLLLVFFGMALLERAQTSVDGGGLHSAQQKWIAGRPAAKGQVKSTHYRDRVTGGHRPSKRNFKVQEVL